MYQVVLGNAKTVLMKIPRLLSSSELFYVTKSVHAAESADLGLRPRVEQVESEDISRDSCIIGIITNNAPTPQLLIGQLAIFTVEVFWGHIEFLCLAA